MAYDVVRQRGVLFGGDPAGTDTWEWDGANWTQIEETGPPRRLNPAMAFDELRARVVLFGGGSFPSGRLNDT